MEDDDGKIYLADMAKQLGRQPHTIRVWINHGRLTGPLAPHREGKQERIYWTVDQLPALEEFANALTLRQGFQKREEATA